MLSARSSRCSKGKAVAQRPNSAAAEGGRLECRVRRMIGSMRGLNAGACNNYFPYPRMLAHMAAISVTFMVSDA